MGLAGFLIIAALILVNAFFVAAEFALVKVRIGQIEQLAEEGNWAAKLTKRALDRLDSYLSASQLGITVASLALGQEIEHALSPSVTFLLGVVKLPAGTITVAVQIVSLSIGTFLHMALGEQAPKSLAIRSAKVVALWTAPVLVVFYYVFWPSSGS